jgi:hypothetical protein
MVATKISVSTFLWNSKFALNTADVSWTLSAAMN